MSAAAKVIQAKIRSNRVTDYFFSTHFWAPVSNFGIPLAAVNDLCRDASLISGPMTGALTVYSITFMRYSLAIRPKNYLLFLCHFANFNLQVVQGFRALKHWRWNGHYEPPGPADMM